MATMSSWCYSAAKLISHRLKNTQQLSSFVKHFSALKVSPSVPAVSSAHISQLNSATTVNGFQASASCNFHTTRPAQDLMEFFERKDMWGESSVPAGRPYRLDELRIKSNQDLHKLWYVLLKERNMLLTMEAEYIRRCELFPNPERTTKVEESMENILAVVKERDNAVSLLETGKRSDPGGAYVRDFLGRYKWRDFKEYGVPPHMNKVHRLLHPKGFKKLHLKYLPLWREKIAKHRWYFYHNQLKENKRLIEKFPHLEGKLDVPLPEEPKIN